MKVKQSDIADLKILCSNFVTDTPSPTPVRRRASSIMPGTLYEPSPTPEPEPQDERRVRFASGTTSPLRYQPTPPSVPQCVRQKVPRVGPSRTGLNPALYDEISSATSPPSTADSDDVSISQDSQSLGPQHNAGTCLVLSNAYNNSSSVSHRVVQAPTFQKEDSISFASSSERSFEQERILELEKEVRKLKEEVILHKTSLVEEPHDSKASTTNIRHCPSTSTAAAAASSPNRAAGSSISA